MATLGEQAVGSIVKLNVDGVATNFIVVHQGLPGTMYDSSCNGTWLLMEDVYTTSGFGESNDYANSNVHSYLNDTFLGLLDSGVRDKIKQVKIPYYNGAGESGSIAEGSNGLSTKIFILSRMEIGLTLIEGNLGTFLTYFNTTDNAVRIAHRNGATVVWWTRSINPSGNKYVYYTTKTGTNTTALYVQNYGVRPAFVMPPETAISPEGMIGDSKSITGSVIIGGVQRELTGKGYINIGGVLRDLSDSQVNIGGVLKSLKG